MKKIVIVHDRYDNSKNEYYEAEELSPFLFEYFKGKRPENLRFYHESMSHETDVTPKTIADVDRLEALTGTIYVEICGAWIWYVYYAVVAIAAIFSVYSILTMPKPSANGGVGSSNNELSNRSNKARVNSRKPDIYGTVRGFPDLVAATYTYYEEDNGREVEECLLEIGRGHFQVHDCRDGDTAVEGIDGVSISIYDPGVNIRGNTTIYKSGDSFTSLPLAVRKSDAINGQSLEKPNDLKLESSSIYFMTGGVIRSTDSSIDFTKYFKTADGIAITGAQYGVRDAILSGSAIVTSDFKVIVQSVKNIESFAEYKGLLLTGATFEYVVEETTIDPETGASTTKVIERSFRDISGQYEVASVIQTQVGSVFTYTIQLSSPKQVNYNWNYVIENQTISAGIVLNKNANTMNLDDNYSASIVTSSQITLANASTVNQDWLKLPTLFNGSTQGYTANVNLDIVASKWVGWFNIFFDGATHLTFNIYAPQGMYSTTDSGGERQAGCTVTIQYQMLDDNGAPIGEIITKDWAIWNQTKSSFGRTARYALPGKGNVRFRLSKTYAKENNRPVTEVKIKDVYASYAHSKSTYPGVTIVRSKTVATDGAMSVKDRKLNCLVTRKLKVDGTGQLVVTRDAGQALIDMALDPYVGRRSINEIDIDQIKSEIQKVKDYFGSDKAVEFCYTFDDDKLSFEEMVGMVASACFCEAYRYGNKIRFKFEQPQPNSVLLFNHRNKVPGSEKRTWTIGINKDYDGVELEWTDPSDDTRTTYSVPEDGSAKNPLKITTSGIRNEAQAKTRAWREWNKLLYQTESVEFDALDESNLLQRNDRILVADGTSLETQDGEIESVDVLTLTLSQDVNFEDGQIYYIHLQMPDASIDIIQCLKAEQSNQVILIRAPRMPLVIDDDRYIRTTYSIIKATDTDRQAFLLTEMSPNDAMTNKLTCINYDDRYYEKDHSFF
ncbi:host specificity factor TipJ family phage tail protein [Acinetobacter rudis]|uniref:host specificity factor TipJ family phage tail protein n=1 Tax=Acinetobacter rudis TaxID=632955 RepID=UPI00280FD417|nr:host specificity factor TipJ family phage tail protein [Acinetobacter rudis]MDQ8951934.1 host specificity factor TipJ family phage tail protein [Acinetobacter rudis]